MRRLIAADSALRFNLHSNSFALVSCHWHSVLIKSRLLPAGLKMCFISWCTSMCLYVWGDSVRLSECVWRTYVCSAGEGAFLNDLPLCAHKATDLYHHHSSLKRTRANLITRTARKAPLYASEQEHCTHKRNTGLQCGELIGPKQTHTKVI